MNKKKLFRITTVPKSFGLLKYQLKYLNQFFDVVAVSSPGKELEEVREREGVQTISLKMERKISVFHDIASLYNMWRLFVREKPYIIHSHTDKAGLIAMMAGKLAGVPHRIHTYAGLIFPTCKGLKRYVLWTTDWLTAYCSTISVPEGLGVKNDLLNSGIRCKSLEVLEYGSLCGVDIHHYSKTKDIMEKASILRAEYGINDTEIVFSFIGRIVKDKGIVELVKAFIQLIDEHHINARLIIAGDFDDNSDPVGAETEKLIKEHCAIHWLGFVKDVRPVFQASDVFVLPSYREGFPNVVLQACAMEIPVIVTDINGSNEIVKNGFNGLVVPSQNTVALQDSLKYMCSDPLIRKEYGVRGRQVVVEKYNQQLIWKALKNLYTSLS